MQVFKVIFLSLLLAQLFYVAIAFRVDTFAGGPKQKGKLHHPRSVRTNRKGSFIIANDFMVRSINVKTRNMKTLLRSNKNKDKKGSRVAFSRLSEKKGDPVRLSATDIAVGKKGTIYISSRNGHVIYKVRNNKIRLFAGKHRKAGLKNGKRKQAQFKSPNGIVLDGRGNLYVADRGNKRIRKITPKGKVTTFAKLKVKPQSIDIDGCGTLYVAGQNRILQITSDRKVKTLFKRKKGKFNGIAVHKSGNIYFGDLTRQSIFKLNTKGKVTRFAGTGKKGLKNGKANKAQFRGIRRLSFNKAQTALMVADTKNNRIRRITPEKGEKF